jgi:hypothetical protein
VTLPASAAPAVPLRGARTSGGLLPAVLALLALGAAAGFYGSAARVALWTGPEAAARMGSGLLLSMAVAGAALLLLRRSSLPGLTAFPARAGLAGALALGSLCFVIGLVAFDGFPNSADEYGFLSAAETLVRGRVANPPTPDPDLFRQVYLITRDGIWVSQYCRAGPPRWPPSACWACPRCWPRRSPWSRRCCCCGAGRVWRALRPPLRGQGRSPAALPPSSC